MGGCCSRAPGPDIIPSGSAEGLRRLGWGDYDEAVSVVARSFAGTVFDGGNKDPEWAMDWILGAKCREPEHQALRIRGMRELTYYGLRQCITFGMAYGLEDKFGQLIAVAMVYPPGRRLKSGYFMVEGCNRRFMDFMCWAMCFAPKKIRGKRAVWEQEEGKLMPGAHERLCYASEVIWARPFMDHTADKAYHLQILAVDLLHQGKGLGKRLVGALCDACERLGKDLYLECAGIRNRTFYEKLGFTFLGSNPLTKKGHSEDYANEPDRYIENYMVRHPTLKTKVD